MRVLALPLVVLAMFASTEAVNLRGNSVSCPTPASVFQGSRSFSGTSAGSTVSYKCDKGTYMVGSASATCTDRGTWSAQPPECRVEYTTKKDNTFKNGDKGYKLYSG